MKLVNVMRALRSNAWAMKPDYLRDIAGVVAVRHLKGEGISSEEVESLLRRSTSDAPEVSAARKARRADVIGIDGSAPSSAGKKKYELSQGVAVVRVWGSLHKYASWMDTTSFAEGVSYQFLSAALREAAADSETRCIVLHIDSPGGQVDGIDQFCGVIESVRTKKPVHAFIDDMGCSAAYWIASQCQSIVANPTASVGSIGVYTVLMDLSKMYEEAGVKVHVVKDGAHKGIGASGAPLTETDLVVLQEDVVGYGKLFREAVVAGRPSLKGSIEKLADGRWHLAEKAKELGLVDRVQRWDAFAQGLRTRHSSRAAEQDARSLQASRGEASAKAVATAPRAGVVVLKGQSHMQSRNAVSYRFAKQ